MTHHKKGIRALVQHAKEYTFASGSSDNIKKWQLPEGRFMQNVKHYEGGPHKHRAGVETIVNAMVSIKYKDKRELARIYGKATCRFSISIPPPFH